MVFNPAAPALLNFELAGCPSFAPLPDGNLAQAEPIKPLCRACGQILPDIRQLEELPDDTSVAVPVRCPRTQTRMHERRMAEIGEPALSLFEILASSETRL